MTIGIESSSQFIGAHPWLQVQSQLPLEVHEQESLPDMLDDFKAKCKALEKKIADFKKELSAHESITADLRAAQAALESYLLAHKDQQGDIKTGDIKVFLPETSPLRTGKTETVSFRELMSYYQEAQPALQLPAVPESISVSDIGKYQKSLDQAVVTASSFFNEVKQSDLSEIVSRRQSLIELMGHLIKTYSDLMVEGLRR